jgi:hypothetical protein
MVSPYVWAVAVGLKGESSMDAAKRAVVQAPWRAPRTAGREEPINLVAGGIRGERFASPNIHGV